MDTEIQYISYQTGKIREKVLTENLQENFSKDFTFVSLDNNNRVCSREFLSHKEEALGEMTDFKHKFQHLFNNPKSPLYNYKVFLSIGSTSTQGWKINDDGSYELIIPPNGDNPFMMLGAKQSKENLFGVPELIGILSGLDINSNKKILCFNAIGYAIPKTYKPPEGKIPNIANITDNELEQTPLISKLNLQLSIPDTTGKLALIRDNMDIYSRNAVEPTTNSKIEGSWASGLAIEKKANIIDIGGGAVHIYEANTGKKLTTTSLVYRKGPNIRKTINPNELYFPSKPEKTTDELVQIDSTLLDHISLSLHMFIILPRLLGGQKSKRRKSKRKRSKRRHR